MDKKDILEYIQDELLTTQAKLETYGGMIVNNREVYMNKIKFLQGERSAYNKIIEHLIEE
jgi:cob(I)alamin adenosyltransferase